MKEPDNSDITPGQQTGTAIDAESSIELSTDQDAKTFFETVKTRLQSVNEWKDLAGNLSATFQLVDHTGAEVERTILKGDYFKIDIPGPGSKSGDGYDWVQIEEVETDVTPEGERFGFRVRPTDNPQSAEREVAHFYSDESTSSFVVERKGNRIIASIHDRNTKPNTDAERPADKVRDVVVGSAGIISFSKIQWQNLTNGLLKK